MKKIAVIFLVLIMLVEVTGLYGVFLFQRYAVKKEMKAWLLNNRSAAQQAFTTFVVDKNTHGIEWENDHEFFYAGQMYDVVEKKQTGGQLQLTCISDEKETGLVASFTKNILKNHSGKSKDAQSLLMQLILSPYISEQSSFCLPTFLPMKAKGKYAEAFIPEVFSQVVIPPPRTA